MRKRSKYRPYRVDRSAWSHCIGMQQQLTDDQLTDLGVAVRISIENMRTGNGGDRDWHTLTLNRRRLERRVRHRTQRRMTMIDALIAGAAAGSWPAALVLCVGALACAAVAIAPLWALSKGM